MNQKASVSKELNAKHRKILEGLLKLSENRECAECKSKAPRWASVNLGIFICMQCSGIHRSLGVHISKVRSATLDTWLPDQIAFIQAMGNEKSNSYWEAELPPKYDRVGIENFIRAKYVEKRWISRDGKAKPPSVVTEDKGSIYKTRPVVSSGTGYVTSVKNFSEEGKSHQLPDSKRSVPATKSSNPVPPKVSQQVSLDPKPQEIHQKPELASSKAEVRMQESNAVPVVSTSKVDYATELFNMLSMEDSRQSDSKTSAADDNKYTGPQPAEATSTAGKRVPVEIVESKSQSNSGIEELFKDIEWVTPPISDKPTKDVNNNIMNIFDKSSMVSPFSVHQQQLAMLAQQQSFFMAAGANSSAGPQTFGASIPRPGSNGVYISPQNRGSIGNHFPGLMMPTVHPQTNMQIGKVQPSHPAGSYAPYPTSSMYTAVPVAPINGKTLAGASGRPPSTLQAQSVTPTPSGRDYDFSSLMQGMFTKQ